MHTLVKIDEKKTDIIRGKIRKLFNELLSKLKLMTNKETAMSNNKMFFLLLIFSFLQSAN